MTISGPPGPPPYPPISGAGDARGPVAVGVPPPPPGPGVTPPFAAPPTEGRTRRLWLGLGAGALALVLCCGGGGAALVGLALTSTEAFKEHARAAAGEYFAAVRDKDYRKAYNLLCDDEQNRESPDEFEERISAEPEIASYKVDKDVGWGDETYVTVDITYTGGGQDTNRVDLVTDTKTGSLEVCGIS